MVIEILKQFRWERKLPWNQFVLITILFALVFAIKWVAYGLIVLLWVQARKRWMGGRVEKFLPIISVGLIFILLYAFHLIGMIWTENVAVGFDQLEYKLALVLVPLIFYMNSMELGRKQWNSSIILGLAFCAVCMLLYATYRSCADLNDNQWGYFEESLFCIFMHRSYTAAYMVVGVAIALQSWLNDKRYFWWVYIALFSGITVLSGSKAGLIALISIFFWYGAAMITRLKFWTWKRLLGIITLTGVLFFAVFQAKVSRRFGVVYESISNIQWTHNSSTESTTARLLMWNASLHVWSCHRLIGVGTGDVTDELVKVNEQWANDGVVKSRLNAHNQFLNVAVQFGAVGGMLLCGWFILFFYWAVAYRDWMLGSLTLIFLINFLFESFIETRAGIVPFTLIMLSYLLVIKKEAKLNN